MNDNPETVMADVLNRFAEYFHGQDRPEYAKALWIIAEALYSEGMKE